jgi:hypothetical protein
VIRVVGRLAVRLLGWRLGFHFQKLSTLRELLLAVPVAQQAVVTDALHVDFS